MVKENILFSNTGLAKKSQQSSHENWIVSHAAYPNHRIFIVFIYSPQMFLCLKNLEKIHYEHSSNVNLSFVNETNMNITNF